MAQHRKERGRVEEHDKKVRMCTSEPVKGNEGQEQWKREKNRKGKNKKSGKEVSCKDCRTRARQTKKIT